MVSWKIQHQKCIILEAPWIWKHPLALHWLCLRGVRLQMALLGSDSGSPKSSRFHGTDHPWKLSGTREVASVLKVPLQMFTSAMSHIQDNKPPIFLGSLLGLRMRFSLNIRRLKLWWCVLFPLWIAIRCHINICAAIYSIPHIIMATVIKLCPHCPLFSQFFLVSPSSIPSIFPFVALRIIPVCSLLFPFSPWFLDFMIYSIYRIYSFNPTTNHGNTMGWARWASRWSPEPGVRDIGKGVRPAALLRAAAALHLRGIA